MAKRKYFLFTIEEGKRLPRIAMRSWGFVVVVGLVLATLSILDRGGLAAAPAAGSCDFTVTTPTLNVRAAPTVTAEQVQQLTQDSAVTATNIVTGGFRKLSERHWALDQYLTLADGATCG